ncbi:MAG: DUF3574 domain-containing protein [Alphaproteobacteria bacterium]|nr:DUF3574 domain-containing protein [Alphaproteobacteria bacterium]MCW5744088.1 DUF3574 domain-containing protein [Alphaproteobacteria bacterium]
MIRGGAIAALLTFALGGCAAAPSGAPTAPACRAPLKAMTQVDLYFGRYIPGGGGEVSDAQWRRFLDEVVTPRFPDGLSVLDVHGQWKSTRTGTIARERSKRLSIIVPDAAAAAANVEAIKAAYRQRFRQESVLQSEAAVCAAF